MNSVVLTVLAALVACALGLPNVLKFNIEDQPQPKKKVQLQKYQFTNCLPKDKEAAVISNLDFQPDPLVFPGPLTVSFTATAKTTINTPLQAVVYLGKKVGSIWVKIPCIGQIGSCTYPDLCQILAMIPQCPDAFINNNVPCQCPFNTGTYTLPSSEFDVDASIFPAGDYHGQANLTMGDTVVGCYDIMVTMG